ncbi:vegetative mycelium hydrophobin 2 expressed in monokaryotic and dikaryotic micelia [Pleurotus ostreatus PC15]|uniref:Class I hydrophobin 2 n=1 Tax=Pleurotus ostreatus (strain PC15) TaxID=1137138 RepID=VMH2_PLEO1|nr:vegetative mycelium hydrophobin 2 expressed in monokaryotic and dikaryotic micelia [Pleurotus ostreatus PC15]
MFSRVMFCTFLILPLLAAATAIPRTDTPSCSTGSLQCCSSVQKASDPLVGIIVALLGIVLGPLDLNVGLTCSPITVIGVGGTSCTQQTVCCTGNNFDGLIVAGCSPINIGL